MTTKRKPYVRGMEANWWRKLGFYRFYMLREGTAVPATWFSLLVLYGLFALKNGPESWADFVSFLQHPIVLLINIITLLAALLHTKTWFELAPKALNLIVKNEKMPPGPIVKLLWATTIIATAVILGVALLF
ncbi:fumarate reductase subunit FrdC [Xenorhabdus entomophaga]|uniref:fumarate reductase subunit FrdC n=1 Tax=Xenorhabdus entomophaga TaxID=3136257 RepID=UPI0030F43803